MIDVDRVSKQLSPRGEKVKLEMVPRVGYDQGTRFNRGEMGDMDLSRQRYDCIPCRKLIRRSIAFGQQMLQQLRCTRWSSLSHVPVRTICKKGDANFKSGRIYSPSPY